MNFIKKLYLSSFIFLFFAIASSALAGPPYAPGETLDPTCSPGAVSCSTTSFDISTSTGNLGLGTSSPYAKLSVVGQVVAEYFTSTSTATSTFGGGINLTSGCYAISGVCITAGSAVYSTSTASNGIVFSTSTNVFSLGGALSQNTAINLNTFSLNILGSLYNTTFYASSTYASTSYSDILASLVSTELSSTTIYGSLIVGSIISTSTGTTTFSGGINLTGGCFAILDMCIGSSSLSVSYFISENSTTTNATTTTLYSENTVIGTNISVGTTTSQPPSLQVAGGVNLGGGNYIPVARFSGTDTGVGSVISMDAKTGGSGGLNWDIMSTGSANASVGSGKFAIFMASSTTPVNSQYRLVMDEYGHTSIGYGAQNTSYMLEVKGDMLVADNISTSYIVSTSTATSTFGGGIDIAEGCYAMAGTCISQLTPNSTTTSFYSETSSSTNLFSTNANIGYLTAGSFSIGEFVLGLATGTAISANTLISNILISTGTALFENSTTTNATSTNIYTTVASSTDLFSTNANFGYLNIGNAVFIEATSTNIFSSISSSTDFFSTNANLGYLTAGTLTMTDATSTTFYSDTSSSSNLYSINSNIGVGTFSIIEVADATSTTIYATTASSTNLFSTNLNSGYNTFGEATSTNTFAEVASSTSLHAASAIIGQLNLNTLEAIGASQDALCIQAGQVKVNTGAVDCNVSSLRFKHNVAPLYSESSLSLVLSLRPVSFETNGENEKRLGFIAEEVALVEPRLVFYENDNTTVRGVRYAEISSILTSAIQEEHKRVSELINKIEVINARTLVNKFKELFVEKLVVQELCLEDLCIKKQDLKNLLDKNNMGYTITTQVSNPEISNIIPEVSTTTPVIQENVASSTENVIINNQANITPESPQSPIAEIVDPTLTSAPTPEPANP